MGRTPARALSLPRSERLQRAAEIQAIFQLGERDERPSFVALWRHQDRRRRVGFAVSRRVGGAVDRNRARRRMREAYRRQQHSLQASVDIVFISRPVVLTRPFAQLLEEMRQALEALNRGAARARPRGVPHA